MIEDIINEFDINDDVQTIVPYGEGHINDTYLIGCKNRNYIFQKLNTHVFPNYEGVMRNIALVTEYTKEIIQAKGGDVARETLSLIPSKSGKPYIFTDDSCYRMMNFIESSIVFQQVDSLNILEETGRGFGTFIERLDAFDATKLVEVIPNFHNTEKRYLNFERAVEKDVKNRSEFVKNEILFVKQRKDFSKTIVDLLSKGEIPLRVTHNDTKLNNILFDKETRKAICVIDLDTIMPGTLLYDFGDAVRFACSTALEDEKDTNKVHFNIEAFDAFSSGFIKGIGKSITEKEVSMLGIGAQMMTFECGMRFLTDYLEGDSYFKIKYEDHNLIRARTQFKLLTEMEENELEMEKIVYKYYNSIK